MIARLTGCLILSCLAFSGGARAETVKGKKVALLVGVRDYDHDSLPALKHTENDAEELAAVLAGKGVDFDEVIVLTSTRGAKDAARKPTAENIRAQVKRILGKVTRHDTVLIALAGHGLQVRVKDQKNQKDREESFFCPSDARPRDTDDMKELSKTMIGLRELFRELADSGAGVKLMLVDACRNEPKLGRNMDADSLPRPPRGTAALFSCKGGERAFESDKLGKGHGVFFHHVIEGMKGKAKNRKGEVTWSSLVDYVVENVSDVVPRLVGGGARQTPQEIKNIVGKAPLLRAGGEADEGADALFRAGSERYHGVGAAADYPAAARSFREASEKKHALATAYLGYLEYLGQGTPRDSARGVRQILGVLPALRRAADDGDADACLLLAKIYRFGLSTTKTVIEKDVAQTVRLYRRLEKQGDARALAGLANLHESGQGVDRDPKEAMRLHRLAAEKGHAASCLTLAFAHVTGRGGVERDAKEATRWYRRAADLGLPAAMYVLATRQARGLGTEKDDRESAAWTLRAAEKGHPMAMGRLIWMYGQGKGGVEKDAAQAARWRRQAEALTGVQLNAIGHLYQFGQEVDRDPKEAAEWFKKAADKGDVFSLVSLGAMYSRGKPEERDDKEAAVWFRKAADKGNVQGMLELAGLYAAGRGVEKDEKEALRLHRRAAETNDVTAMALLAWMHAHGKRGADKDEKEADRLRAKVIAAGPPGRLASLGSDFFYGRLVVRDHGEAVKWFREAAQRGDGYGAYMLGEAYSTGRGVAKDGDEALKWYRKAADKGHETAKKKVQELEKAG